MDGYFFPLRFFQLKSCISQRTARKFGGPTRINALQSKTLLTDEIRRRDSK
jgi:hypothetical protein